VYFSAVEFEFLIRFYVTFVFFEKMRNYGISEGLGGLKNQYFGDFLKSRIARDIIS